MLDRASLTSSSLNGLMIASTFFISLLSVLSVASQTGRAARATRSIVSGDLRAVPASSSITILLTSRWFKPPISHTRRVLLGEKYLPRVIGVAILAHLGNLVAVEADVEVVTVVVFLAVSRDGVGFRLDSASVAFANDSVNFEAQPARHHYLDTLRKILEPFMPFRRSHAFHPGHDYPFEVIRDHRGEPHRIGVLELTQKFGG